MSERDYEKYFLNKFSDIVQNSAVTCDLLCQN